jgi:hypothetical protein
MKKLTQDHILAANTYYTNKNSSIASSIERIDRNQCENLINSLYIELGIKNPSVSFFDSPYAIIKEHGAFLNSESEIFNEYQDFRNKSYKEIHSLFKLNDIPGNILNDCFKNNKIIPEQFAKWGRVDYLIMDYLASRFKHLPSLICRSWIQPDSTIGIVHELDCILSIFNLSHPNSFLKLLEDLDEQMGWYIPLREICFVSDRPHTIYFDEEYILHMDGAPAIEYSDGFRIYAFHGQVLPEKYGRVPSSKWEPAWLLEKNSDLLRRTLISGIGFSAIRDSLKLKEIDTWKNYQLWRVENESKGKPLVLLTKQTSEGIMTDSINPKLNKVQAALQWLKNRSDREDMFYGS